MFACMHVLSFPCSSEAYAEFQSDLNLDERKKSGREQMKLQDECDTCTAVYISYIPKHLIGVHLNPGIPLLHIQ